MSIAEFEKYSPSDEVCALRDKAFYHVAKRAVASFENAKKIRSELKTKEDVELYRKNNRKIICDSLGEVPYDKNLPLNAEITGVIEDGEFIIEKVVFQTLENMFSSANLYMPKNKSGRLPGVVFLTGHSANGKAAEGYQRAARIISRAGFAVLVTEPEGQGERLGYINSPEEEPIIYGAVANHQRFGHQCFLAGESSVKYFVADAMRSYDYLVSRDDIDGERIGITGISGGGTISSLTAAYDLRFNAAAPGCWPTSGEDYFFIGTSPDSEQIWPGVFENNFDHHELMSLICPRPLMLLTAEYDFVPIEGSKKLFKECKRIWNLYGNEENVEIAISPHHHSYSDFMAVSAATFFQKHIGYEQFEVTNENIYILPDEELNACKSGYVKFDFNSEFVFDKNLKIYNENNYKTLPLEVRRKKLYEIVTKGRDLDFEINVRHQKDCEADGLSAVSYFWFTQKLLPNYAVLICKSENRNKNLPITICLWPDGTDSIDGNSEIIKNICDSDRKALVLDVTALGKCKPTPLHNENGDFRIIDKISKTMLQLGDSLCALRAFDLMCVIKLAKDYFSASDVSIYTKDELSVIARICEVLDSDIKVETENEVTIESIVTNRIYHYDDTTQLLVLGLGKLIE